MRILKIYRLAQMPPPGMPPMGPPPGMPPMGPPPGGPPPPGMPPMGGPPMPPPSGTPPGTPKEKIGSPLATVFEILYDADALTNIQGAGKSINELSNDIWTMYGGTETGEVNPGKVGQRPPDNKNVSPEQEEHEEQATENSRWRRLPLGKNIGDITTLEELHNSIEGIMSGVKKPPAPPGGPGGAPPGMPPGLASILPHLVRLAALYDSRGEIEKADILDKIWNS